MRSFAKRMEFHVEIMPPAERDLHQAFKWIAKDSVSNAHRWYNRMLQKPVR